MFSPTFIQWLLASVSASGQRQNAGERWVTDAPAYSSAVNGVGGSVIHGGRVNLVQTGHFNLALTLSLRRLIAPAQPLQKLYQVQSSSATPERSAAKPRTLPRLT